MKSWSRTGDHDVSIGKVCAAIAAAASIGIVASASAADRSARHGTAFAHAAALQAAVADSRRTPVNVLRDKYRHPAETLSFFGIEPGDTVVEIWPGGGWYTEILTPYLASGGGKLILATLDGQLGGVAKLGEGHPDLYRAVTTAVFPAFDANAKRVPDGAADAVVTFRNVHNWRMGYKREGKPDYSLDAFKQMYAMLKPGGVLGVEDHRLPETGNAERERSSGYIRVSTVRGLAEAAGFRFAGASDINANPKDTADWPNGVWTLPPTLALKDQDRDRYLAIGESDRMTLKFVKPH
jgi:predicted methyltransferase